jgi:hypothetical protein
MPLGAMVLAAGFVTATSSNSAQPSGTVNLITIESSAVDSAQPAWPAQVPIALGAAHGVAVWVPAAIRSPITSGVGLGAALGRATEGLIVGVEVELGEPAETVADVEVATPCPGPHPVATKATMSTAARPVRGRSPLETFISSSRSPLARRSAERHTER